MWDFEVEEFRNVLVKHTPINLFYLQLRKISVVYIVINIIAAISEEELCVIYTWEQRLNIE